MFLNSVRLDVLMVNPVHPFQVVPYEVKSALRHNVPQLDHVRSFYASPVILTDTSFDPT